MQHFVQQLAREAGDIAKTYFYEGVNHTVKGGKFDLLTVADGAVSDFIVKKIREAYPEHHIFSEELEEQINVGAEYEWVIDPIDGTYNFAHGIPTWAVMITVVYKGDALLAVIYFPLANEMFFAKKGEGCFNNGKRVNISAEKSFMQAIGIAYRQIPDRVYGEKYDEYRNIIAAMSKETNAQMCNYAAGSIVAYVAKGGFDFAIANAGLDWDLLPIMLICREAGAICTHLDGTPWTRGHQDYLIAGPELHKQILSFVRNNI